MMVISEALLQHQSLSSGSTYSDSAKLDVELLLGKVLGRDRSYLYTWPERLLTELEQQQFFELLRRRQAGEPIAYLLGRRAFWTLDLKVSPATLIPRPDTELLVEHALSLPLPPDARILDLGTGTGAIALALASERPDWQVTATDRWPEVVALARENIELHQLQNVTVICSDWFAALPMAARFDLIVSNPPYIDATDSHLGQGDLRFEPSSALVSGDQGLADLKHIAGGARNYLHDGGWLLLEHGYQQGQDVRSCLADAGFQQVHTILDLGAKERATLGHKQKRINAA